MPIPVRYHPPTSIAMSSQRTIPYWDAIKIAETNPAKGKSTVPRMTSLRPNESSSVAGCGEAKPDSIGKCGGAFDVISLVWISVCVKFLTVGAAGMSDSLRVDSVTDAMKRFLSEGDCPNGESD